MAQRREHVRRDDAPAVRRDGWRCHSCDLLHMEVLTRPYRWTCPRCGSVNADAPPPALDG